MFGGDDCTYLLLKHMMKIKKAKIYLSTIDKLNGYIVFKNLQINLHMVSQY